MAVTARPGSDPSLETLTLRAGTWIPLRDTHSVGATAVAVGDDGCSIVFGAENVPSASSGSEGGLFTVTNDHEAPQLVKGSTGLPTAQDIAVGDKASSVAWLSSPTTIHIAADGKVRTLSTAPIFATRIAMDARDDLFVLGGSMTSATPDVSILRPQDSELRLRLRASDLGLAALDSRTLSVSSSGSKILIGGYRTRADVRTQLPSLFVCDLSTGAVHPLRGSSGGVDGVQAFNGRSVAFLRLRIAGGQRDAVVVVGQNTVTTYRLHGTNFLDIGWQ